MRNVEGGWHHFLHGFCEPYMLEGFKLIMMMLSMSGAQSLLVYSAVEKARCQTTAAETAPAV